MDHVPRHCVLCVWSRGKIAWLKFFVPIVFSRKNSWRYVCAWYERDKINIKNDRETDF